MARYKFIVLANAKEGRDADYNEWYDRQHIPDVLAVPGFVSCERLQYLGEGGKWQYCAIYEVETDDVGKMMADLGSRFGTERMPATDALHEASLFSGLFVPRASVG